MFQLHFIYIVIPCNHSYSIVIFLVSSNCYRISASFHFIRVTISCYQICKSFLASYFESNLSLLRLASFFILPDIIPMYILQKQIPLPYHTSLKRFQISFFFRFLRSNSGRYPSQKKEKKKKNIANIIHFHEIELKSLHDKIGSFISNNIHVSSILDEFFFSKI